MKFRHINTGAPYPRSLLLDPLLSLPPREVFINRYKPLIYTAQNDVSLNVNCKEIPEAYTYETHKFLVFRGSLCPIISG